MIGVFEVVFDIADPGFDAGEVLCKFVDHRGRCSDILGFNEFDVAQWLCRLVDRPVQWQFVEEARGLLGVWLACELVKVIGSDIYGVNRYAATCLGSSGSI